MRLKISPDSIRLGDVALHKTFQVTELDAGYIETKQQRKTVSKSESEPEDTSIAFSQNALHRIEQKLAIIIPCMDEPLRLLEGVLRGIPHACLIILVSNSKNDTPDSNFTRERELLTKICAENKRAGIIMHQADEGLAEAFKAAGMPTLVQEVNQLRPDGTKHVAMQVRKGKGEAMVVGVVLAKLAGKRCIGFIDADNWVPGAVHEYCKVYAAGLQYAVQLPNEQSANVAASKSPRPEMHVMVRVRWNSKPKVENDQLVHKDSGRCSRVVNSWMNRFLNVQAPENAYQDLVQTANAGEHAMDIELAMRLHFATGYAVEPYQLVDIIEQFGARTSSSANDVCGTARTVHFEGSTQTPVSESSVPQVRITQVRTCNPHIHDFSKGDQHIENMQVQGLGAIYHSALASCKLKEELRSFMKDCLPAGVDKSGVPERPIVYPSLDTLDLRVLQDVLTAQSSTLGSFGSV